MFLSIIIPVYNTPLPYFQRCIESIEKNNDNNYEIIIVDDGSEDNLSREYKSVVAKHSNIIYQKKINEGVSAARNLGILISMGTYLTFVDADDTVSSEFIIESEELANRYKSDLIIGTISYVPQVETNQYRGNNVIEYKEDSMYNLKFAYIKSLIGKKLNCDIFAVLGSPCGRLYKRNLLNDIQFPLGISHWEDQIFNRMIFDTAKSAVIVSNTWYYYYQNSFSAFHLNINEKYLKKAYGFWEIWDELNQKENQQYKRYYYLRDITWFYSAVYNGIIPLKTDIKHKIKMIHLLYDIDLFKHMATGLHLRDFTFVTDMGKFLLIKFKLTGPILFLLEMKAYLFRLKRGHKINEP